MKRIAVVAAVAVIAAVSIPGASAATATKSIDTRTRTIVYLVKKCRHGVQLSLAVVQLGANVQASEAVNLVKRACDTYGSRLLTISSKGLGRIPDDAYAAIDYWKRGLGRISDYIDNGKPSDLVTAKQYLGSGQSYWSQTHREINALRAKSGLARI